MATQRKRSILILMAAAAMVASALPLFPQAEHGSETSKVVRLNRAPVSSEILHVTLPRPVATKLANGLTVMVLEQHKLPTVHILLQIGTGDMSDPKETPGLASFTAGMLREGTTHRTSAQLAADVDKLGAMLNCSSGFGSSDTRVSASGLSPSTSQILELMSDVVLHPAFPSDELEKYKQRQLSDLEQQRSQPRALAEERLRQALYGDFPAAVTMPTPESINAATAERLKEFHDRNYVPSNAILIVVGDVKADEFQELARKYFGDWSGEPVPKPDWSHLPAPAAAKIYLVDRPDSVQTNILAGDYGPMYSDPDFIAFQVANRVLGGGPQARLFLNLREVHGYTYGAYSRYAVGKYRMTWTANTEVRNAVTDGSMEQLMAELKRIRNEKVPEAELNEARHSLIANFALALENPQELLSMWLTVQDHGLPMDYWDRLPARIAQTTADAAQAAARNYVDLDHLQIVCVGDPNQPGNDKKQTIREVLAKYGTVEVYDTNGKKEE
jgi:zinc protease